MTRAQIGRPAPLPGDGRTARSQRTRARLLDAARSVFNEHGFFDAKIADIADRAGVAHGSFYTHFVSKEDVFRAVLAQVFDESLRLTAVRRDIGDDSTPRERIEATNRRYLDAYRTNARIFASLEQVAATNPVFARIRADTRDAYISRTTASIRRWQDMGLVATDLDAECLAHVLGSTVERFAYMRYVFGEGCLDEERALRSLDHVWAAALGLDDGARSARSSREGTAGDAAPVLRRPPRVHRGVR